MGCSASSDTYSLTHAFILRDEAAYLTAIKAMRLKPQTTFIVNFGWARAAKNDFHEFTALQAACHCCFAEVVEYFITEAARKGKPLPMEAVPIDKLKSKAIRFRRYRRTNKGKSALLSAMDCDAPCGHNISDSFTRKKAHIITMLLDAGADVHAVDARGLSVLSFATAHPSEFSIVKTLLQMGADPHTKDEHGLTLLDKCPRAVRACNPLRALLREHISRVYSRTSTSMGGQHRCEKDRITCEGGVVTTNDGLLSPGGSEQPKRVSFVVSRNIV